MLKKIGIIIVVLVVALLVFAATRPDSFCVQRATTVKATPDKIQPLIDDFHKWGSWSPYEKVDPAMKRSYSAVYAWEGNHNVGAGRMEILETSPSGRSRKSKLSQEIPIGTPELPVATNRSCLHKRFEVIYERFPDHLSRVFRASTAEWIDPSTVGRARSHLVR